MSIYDNTHDQRAMESVEDQRDQLRDALRTLCETWDEYGEPSNVAVNQAWLAACDTLKRLP